MAEVRPDSERRRRRATTPRHGRLKATRPLVVALGYLGIALAVILVSGTSVAALAMAQVNNSIMSVTLVGQKDTPGPPPALSSYEGGFNVLIVGSDVCEDNSGCNGRGSAELNDVTILLHVSADQTNAVAVSIPRDMVVPIPSCPDPKGGNFSAMSAMPINNTLYYGGLPCTVLTVSKLTGLDIPFAVEVKFSGVVNISTAIGGVPVCIDGPINDRYSGFSVPAAGEYTLSGQDALNFLRTRHGVGDAGDLSRISSQQQFLASMVRTIKAPGGALSDPVKLFTIATAVGKNTIVSSNLKNVSTMLAMAQVLKGLPLENVVFVQYPSVTGQPGVYAGKVAPVVGTAAELFAKIKADVPFQPAKTGLGSKEEPASTPAPQGTASAAPTLDTSSEVVPGVQGQTAAENTCAVHRN
ncbi:MAG: LytR family transcriptional regulator [Microbacteriaceae bacterium]|nr:LytR family transcriptional regulator [Microbacteriaceae bacterium]